MLTALFRTIMIALFVTVSVVGTQAPRPAAAADIMPVDTVAADAPAGPIDYGARRPVDTTADGIAAGADAHRVGAWSPVATWPLSAIHAVLLPDGRVLSYGTDDAGRESYGFTYDIWDPALGLAPDSHTTLPVTTGTNLFCSAQAVVPSTGQVLITGGDENGQPGGGRNDAVNDVNTFDPATGTVTRMADSMSRARWYPTTTTLPSGDVLVHGGRDDQPGMRPALMPEVYSPTDGWRRLPGAASRDVYDDGRFWYPRSWVAPDGNVFIVTKGNKGMWSLDPDGKGSVRSLGTYPAPSTNNTTPAVMFDEGRILLTRGGGAAAVIDINGAKPKVTETDALSSYRAWSDATVLANGEVVVTGGASENQLLDFATTHAEIWDPDTGKWTQGAAAAKARLYHSTAMLLPDGSLLTSGGGPPGPVTNLNSEIYYPPYLFADDGSGDFADRPEIAAVDPLSWGQQSTVTLGDDTDIAEVALVRTGSVTHSWDMEQRWMELDFTQDGDRLTVTAPRDANVAPPGNYLLFALDEAGVPSVAPIVALGTDLAPQSQAADGVRVGQLEVGQRQAGRWIDVAFDQPFARTPIVSFGAASSRGNQAVMPRVRNVTTAGFEFRLDEWGYADGRHPIETVSYVAAEPGRHRLGGITVQAGAVSADAQWRRATFAERFPTAPVVLPQISGDGDPAAVRVDGVNDRGFGLRLTGQESDERRATPAAGATVGYIALTPGRGTIADLPVAVGVTRPTVTQRWSTVRFGMKVGAPKFLAAAQTTTGADPIVARFAALTSSTANVRVQEDGSFDAERGHSGERIGWMAIGTR